jgi:hypothetical protein
MRLNTNVRLLIALFAGTGFGRHGKRLNNGTRNGMKGVLMALWLSFLLWRLSISR